MKKIVLGIVALVLFGGGASWYLVVRQNGSVVPPSSSTGEAPGKVSPLPPMPRELTGVWRPEQFFKWYAPQQQFREVEGSSGERNAFMEFTDGSMCVGPVGVQGEIPPCAQPAPVTIQGDTLRVGSEVATWRVENGKLELTFLEADGVTPKDKLLLTRHER